MAVGVAADGETWAWLGIGQMGAGPLPKPNLRFTTIAGDFRQAMLTNDLFLVLGDAEALARANTGSVAYQLTALILDVIGTLPAADGVQPQVLANVRAFFSTAGYPVYEASWLFNDALTSASPSCRTPTGASSGASPGCSRRSSRGGRSGCLPTTGPTPSARARPTRT